MEIVLGDLQWELNPTLEQNYILQRFVRIFWMEIFSGDRELSAAPGPCTGDCWTAAAGEGGGVPIVHNRHRHHHHHHHCHQCHHHFQYHHHYFHYSKKVRTFHIQCSTGTQPSSISNSFWFEKNWSILILKSTSS